MQAIQDRFDYLFRSTKGLALVAIAMISLVTVIFGMISGPMAEWGIRDVWVRLWGMQLLPQDREGRIIILYHSIAMAVVAIEVYFITEIVTMPRHRQSSINATVTVGYLFSMIFGLWFAYFGHNFIFHGLFIFGQSVMFLGGLMLAAALWPWQKRYYIQDSERSHTKKGIDLERVAFFTMAVATLGSALFGAAAGANFGGSFETFLAEDIIREPVKTPLEMGVIGHLHIMLTLIAVALTLLVGRWLNFRGKLHKVAMILMIIGTIVITLGVWAVVPFQPIAHKIIYVGSMFILTSALLLVIFSWRSLIREGTAVYEKPSFFQKIRALLHDPLKFGATWQMVFMNFVVTFVGIFMAIRLDEIIRVWPAREERIALTGHWHILAGIIATIILFYYADMVGIKGKARQWFGWSIIICSNIAFASVTLFATKRLFVSEAEQQSLVNVTMILVDIGLALVLTAVGLFLLWRLVDLFKADGKWTQELVEAELPPDEPDTQVEVVS